MSDVPSLDSDLEKEQEKSYDRSAKHTPSNHTLKLHPQITPLNHTLFHLRRTVYREDLKALKEQLRSRDRQEGGAGGPGIKASRSAAHGKKGEVPEDTLTLEFVHG